ncbi:nickel-dependent lactate racemase [Candidatus Deferrimicrobium sp.]|uniref:nickel-dependent lactate racemase n=1 Tax=Candidatus Deferrimicrobium sp. TaxID=3060586 RepID=UPI002ED3E5FD
MRPDIADIIRGADIGQWKPVEIEYGDRTIEVLLPPGVKTLGMQEFPPLARPADEIRRSLEDPVGTPPLAKIIEAKGKPAGELTVCITTSDITRPVPYKGESGILDPLLRILQGCGVRRENVTLLVGTGTHRPSTAQEKVAMFGERVASEFRIIDHDCDDESMLTYIGRSRSGTEIHINRHFIEADVKIATGLVESHFMAGVSAGRKAICPALVSRKTIERFHGVQFLSSPKATNLVLEGNPCHEESLEIARKTGVDFIVSTVLNRGLELVGVFSGELEMSHDKAVELVRRVVAIPVEREFDIVLTHGGYVGINHYQNAKAACNALPILREKGFLILAACERDEDPIGPATYKTLLQLLKLQGPDGYLAALLNPAWKFTRDQWEPQMWGKVIEKIGEEGMLYCTFFIPKREQRLVPGTAGWDFLPDGIHAHDAEATQAMVRNALVYAYHHPKWKGGKPSVAFIKEGPYAIPCVQGTPP